MKKIHITSSLRPALFKWKGMTRIIGGTITKVDGKPWNHAYVAIKGEKITLDDIEWSPSFIPSTKTYKPKTKTVKGSKGNTYTITIYANGKQTCTCPGYQYRRFCKHTGAK